MPLPFLEEVMELRMAIEEGKTAGSASPQLSVLEQQLTERRDRLLKEVGESLTRYEQHPEQKGLLKGVRQLLNATKYVQGLLRDLNDR